ncbi:MAG: SpoIID/LytB domain-containing protein [Elusimicrobia bacterium]|nr:SpoIID/LytB domain-containing protein [Elusimicrobiota bacterium]
MRALRLGLVLALLPVAPLRADRRPPYVPPILRIGLLKQTTSVDLGPGDYLLEGPAPRKRLTLKKAARLQIAGAGFIVNKARWGASVILAPTTPADEVWLNGRPYRGRLEVTRTGPAFRVVNLISVEDYLRGVLQMETSDTWPEQALKAQAVISRTYALRNRGRHGRQGFDFCREPHCQTYGGAQAERRLTDAAVDATRGEVLVDRKHRLVGTVYHSCCGGSTESAENVWERGGQPYLAPVSCKWCRGSPHYTWTAKVSNELVTRSLQTGGVPVGTVRALGILSHTPSGRVYRVRVYGDRDTVDLKANVFRNLVDPRLIRSTFWSGLSKRGNVWQIHGRGWGHGVGLCQWGMRSLAEKSMNYGQILRYYYRAVSIDDFRE